MTVAGKRGASAGCFAQSGDDNEPVVVVVLAQDRDSFRCELAMEDALLLGKAISDAAEAVKIPRKRWETDQQIFNSGGEE